MAVEAGGEAGAGGDEAAAGGGLPVPVGQREFGIDRALGVVGLLTDAVRPKYEALGALRYEDMAGDVMINWAELEKPMPTKENLEAAKVAAAQRHRPSNSRR